MQSMTGFGRSDITDNAVTWTVEISAVNRKQLEIAPSLPRELSELETQVRNEVAGHCSRGRVNVSIRSSSGQTSAASLKVDSALAAQYQTALTQLGSQLGLSTPLSQADLLRCPGVIELERTTVEPETAWPPIHTALRAAMAQFVAMRTAEGTALRQDIEARLARIADLVEQIAASAPGVVDNYRRALHQRLADAGLPVDLSDERLIKEIALFADRCDISEELARARSHLAQFATFMAAKEAVGRSLDFLTQELFREFNTMGSKANNAALAHLVVAGKTEIERIREQIQNVE